MFFGGPGNGSGDLSMPASIWIEEKGLELFMTGSIPTLKRRSSS